MNKKYFIWGLGLLGTSLALDLKKAGFQVAGCTLGRENKAILDQLGLGPVYLAEENSEAMWQELASADGVILGTPVDSIFAILEQLQQHQLPSRLWITDMASTKSELMSWVNRQPWFLNFAGSHPMAGSDLSGPAHARAALFERATVFITPSENMQQRGRHYQQTLQQIEQFWQMVGAFPYRVSFHDHDRWAAYLSHGLHLVSCMVSHLLKDIPGVFGVPTNPAGGSFRDITRVAGSNPVLWDGIIGSNRQEVIHYLASLENLTRQWRQDLEKNQLDIRQVFSEAGDIRQKIIKNNAEVK